MTTPSSADGRGPDKAREVDDRTVAALLAHHALIEIRSVAAMSRNAPDSSSREPLDRISFLANVAHNLPMIALPRGRQRPFRPGYVSRNDRTMADRPMSWTWNTAGAPGQQWILRRIAEAGLHWTPPPPLPTPRKDFAEWTPRQRLNVLTGWPVRTPPGKRPLPRNANVLKALGRDQMYALYEEAGRRRFGLGSASPVFRAHLDPGATHYLFPDPPDYYWPDDDGPWWACRVLLRMIDGEHVTGLLAVLPETFAALPSTVPRIRQRRLAQATRMPERDYYLWHRDHAEACSPQDCGYPAEPAG